MKDQDPYVYSGTDVLKNIHNIRDSESLADFEYLKSSMRLFHLELNPIQGNFDLKHLQEIHKHLFQDVYKWAGELRTVDISRGGTDFGRADFIFLL